MITITEGHLKGGRAAFGQFDPGAGNKIGINHHSDIGLVSGTNWFSPPSFNCFNGDVFSFDWKVFDEFDEFSFGGIAIEEGNAPCKRSHEASYYRNEADFFDRRDGGGFLSRFIDTDELGFGRGCWALLYGFLFNRIIIKVTQFVDISFFRLFLFGRIFDPLVALLFSLLFRRFPGHLPVEIIVAEIPKIIVSFVFGVGGLVAHSWCAKR